MVYQFRCAMIYISFWNHILLESNVELHYISHNRSLSPHSPLAPRDDIYPHIACNSNLREIKQERVEHLTSNYELPSPITWWRPGRSECLAVHLMYPQWHLMLAGHQVCAKCAVFSGTCPKLINTVIKHVCLFSANKRSHISQRKMKTDGDPAPRSMQHTSKQLI